MPFHIQLTLKLSKKCTTKNFPPIGSLSSALKGGVKKGILYSSEKTSSKKA